ncbi:MAG TPA: peptidoglycan DD-metalloendopeptidase family protein [Usitatibacter sp.]|nr:peptidoglycan DD-metalloendopeptidase family protein [Usitatibacter sp.]
MKAALALAVVALLAAACAARGPAPVSERPPMPPEPVTGQATPPPPAAPVEKPLPTHTVKKGETLMSIALQYGLDHRELAAWNNIVNPGSLSVGQVLVLAPPAGAAPPAVASPAPTGPVAMPLIPNGPPIEARPLANTQTTKVEPRAEKLPFSDRALAQLSGGEAPLPSETPPAPGMGATPPALPPAAKGTDADDIDWIWPVKGKVIAPFTESSKGIDIAGKKGTAVRAAAAGRVIYADHNLRGYGNLVIIRHNDTWLSAYAHNDKVLVKEQEEVKKGQKIAEMGSSDSDQVELHFEVRRQGKPVDPAKFLPPM